MDNKPTTPTKRRVGRPKTKYKPRGRKAKLNKTLIKEICGYINEGRPVKDACLLAGVSQAIYYRWLQLAEEDIAIGKNTLKVELLEGIKKAEANFKQSLVKILITTASRFPTNAMFLLKTKFRDEYGDAPETKVEERLVNAIDKVLIKMNERELPTDEPNSNE